ncbi:MAG: MEDS domain-containing protein [Candidatus Bathyarchaeaceae archaeon]
MLSLDKNADVLSSFGLTHNQAKVYIAIAKLDIATVSQVSKASKVRREDVYRILPKLKKMGLVEEILGKPTKIRATPVEEALSILIKREQDIANKRVSALIARKDEFLKHFKTYKVKPISEEDHFALISQREGIINRELTMIKNAEKHIDIVTSRDRLLHVFNGYFAPFKQAIRKGVKIRIILDITEHEDSILKILEEYKSFRDAIDLKYTDQPSSHYTIVDCKEALVATSTEPTIGENPYLWTDDGNLVGLLQKNFEGLWHASVDMKTIETEAVAEKLTHFLKDLKPTNHTLFLYESSEAKYNLLFNYLKFGLETGEAAAYIASEESPSQIRDAMKRFGIDVEKYEKTGALRILGYNDFYVIEGKFNLETTMGLINKMYNEALTKGFKGWRGVGEMACFFEYNLIQGLIEYERALHRVLDIPIIAICAYNTNMVIKASNPMDLYNELLKAHGKVLFTGIDNKLGKIEIRQA